MVNAHRSKRYNRAVEGNRLFRARKSKPEDARHLTSRVPRLESNPLRLRLIVRRVRLTMGKLRFHCPECGMGDFEIGPMPEAEIHCVVCLDEQGRLIRLACWEEETDHARLREGLVAA
jgi:hypothetical protein